MRKIKFIGWKEGMRKIPFTKLLHNEGGLTLRDAKDICDGILDGKEYIIDFEDEQTAQNIFKKSVEYQVECELID
ncbi:MAG: hypothetical protein HRT73_08310 [Flavobacteriales bacterium]|nr:hypothetical protein [Flavobacteriales bacterium]